MSINRCARVSLLSLALLFSVTHRLSAGDDLKYGESCRILIDQSKTGHPPFTHTEYAPVETGDRLKISVVPYAGGDVKLAVTVKKDGQRVESTAHQPRINWEMTKAFSADGRAMIEFRASRKAEVTIKVEKARK